MSLISKFKGFFCSRSDNRSSYYEYRDHDQAVKPVLSEISSNNLYKSFESKEDRFIRTKECEYRSKKGISILGKKINHYDEGVFTLEENKKTIVDIALLELEKKRTLENEELTSLIHDAVFEYLNLPIKSLSNIDMLTQGAFEKGMKYAQTKTCDELRLKSCICTDHTRLLLAHGAISTAWIFTSAPDTIDLRKEMHKIYMEHFVDFLKQFALSKDLACWMRVLRRNNSTLLEYFADISLEKVAFIYNKAKIPVPKYDSTFEECYTEIFKFCIFYASCYKYLSDIRNIDSIEVDISIIASMPIGARESIIKYINKNHKELCANQMLQKDLRNAIILANRMLEIKMIPPIKQLSKFRAYPRD